MTREEKFVVNPLIRWFKHQKPKWKFLKPKHGTSATGWDIEARRKNQDLLIEAKYIYGPFLASLNGLVTAPLANRRQHFMKRKYRSWSYGVCWAISTNYTQRNIYQPLFDYFSRNFPFWSHYVRDLHMKYVFFVQDGRVAKISFDKILRQSERYKILARDRKLDERRIIADKLMKSKLIFS